MRITGQVTVGDEALVVDKTLPVEEASGERLRGEGGVAIVVRTRRHE